MANPGYVRSTDGNNADNGSTWALANATLAGAMADQVAGDRIWISDNHAETQASAMTITAPGTNASPNQILFGDDAAEPPTALTTSGSITTTGGNSITINGSFYWYGGTISCGTTASSATLTLAGTAVATDNNDQIFEDVAFVLGSTGGTNRIRFGAASNSIESAVTLINPTFKFASTSQALRLSTCKLRIFGGSIDGAGSAITTLFGNTDGAIRNCEITGFDFTNAAAGLNILPASVPEIGTVILRNCKMPASWSGGAFAGAPASRFCRVELWNCAAAVGSGENNFSMWIEDLLGSAKHETTIVRTGGASDGTTGLAWKIATSADAEFPGMYFRSPDIAIPITSTGSKTFTVHWVSDENVAAGQGAGTGNAFRNDEIWLEAQILGTADSPQATVATGRPTVVATPADHAASTETWTTTGLTTPQKQKATVTVTANEKCTVLLTICVAKADKVIYFCPKVELS